MVNYTGVNHLALATGDMDNTVRYWRDLLQMRLVAGLGRPGYRQYFFQVSDRDLVAFFEWPGIRPIEEKEHGRPTTGPFAFDHVSFGVGSEDELWAIKDRIAAAGFWVSEVIDHGFIHSIYTYDPNGIAIEFSRSIPECDIVKCPVMAERAETTFSREGTEPQPGKWPPVTAPTPKEERKVYPGAGSELFHGRKTQQQDDK